MWKWKLDNCRHGAETNGFGNLCKIIELQAACVQREAALSTDPDGCVLVVKPFTPIERNRETQHSGFGGSESLLKNTRL